MLAGVKVSTTVPSTSTSTCSSLVPLLPRWAALTPIS